MKIKRILAFFIDFYIVCFFNLIISFIIGPYDIRLIIPILLLTFKDIIFKNASIGKKILKIEIRSYNDNIPIFSIMILRNLFLVLWPIEAVVFLICNRSIGDIIFKTKIVDTTKVTLALEKNSNNSKISKETGVEFKPDVEVIFRFNGVRKGPAYSGYRPAHLIKDNYLTTGVHNYIKPSIALPTSEVFGTIAFITPEFYPHSLWVGKIITIQEGARIVGTAEIKKILNPLLELDKRKLSKLKETQKLIHLELIELKNQLSQIYNIIVDDDILKINFHKDFFISTKLTENGYETYINDEFYYIIEEQDILDFLEKFLRNDYVVVQYFNSHIFYHSLFQSKQKFLLIKKNKFNFKKIRCRGDVKIVFDSLTTITINNK